MHTVEILILGTQCLVDVAKGDGNPAHAWYDLQEQKGVQFGDICISAFSIAQMKFFFAKNPPGDADEKALEANLNSLFSDFETAGAVIGCSPAAANYWADFLDEVVIYDLPSPHEVGTEAIVIATVAAGHEGIPCRLVDLLQPIHKQLNISVYDPYAGTSFP